MTEWKCPECNGPHLERLRFRHDPANCEIGRKEDATMAADYDRAAWLPFERAATWAELRLADVIRGYVLHPPAAQFHPPEHPAPEGKRTMTTVSFSSGLRRRIVGGLDPDDIAAKLAEGEADKTDAEPVEGESDEPVT